MLVDSKRLAHCFQGSRFSGVLLRIDSCPLGYLEMVPLKTFGGNEE
jgi:hypothetical protein